MQILPPDPKSPAAAIPSPDDQWLVASPMLRPEIIVELRKQNDRLVAVLEDPVRSKFFQVGVVEYHFLMMLDGKRSVNEVIQDMKSKKGYDDFDQQIAKTICGWLANMNLLNTGGANSTGRLCQAAQALEKQKVMGWLNPVSFRINLMNPDKTLARLAPFTQWFFSTWMVLVWIATAIFAWSQLSTDYERFCDAATGILAPSRWLWLLVVWTVLKIIHEFAHGIACRKYGGNVPQAGMLVLLLAPMAFVNVTSSWRFNSRFKRMVVSAAGMYVELFVAFIAIIFWRYTNSQFVSDLAYNVVVMAGLSTVLFNANPLLRFDGYYLLADGLGVVNMYTKGQNLVNNRIRNLMFGFPVDPDVCSKKERRVVATYGFCALVWRILLSVSLLLVCSTLLDGVGLFLAIIGGVFWIGMPMMMNLKKVKSIASVTPIRKSRVAAFSTVVGLLMFAGFYWFQAPAITRVPAIVQFRDEQMIRAAADGFVSELMVADGQKVDEGEVLVRIENPDLLQELETLKQQAKIASIQARMHSQREELSLQQAELANLDSINEQMKEMQAQANRLEILAPFDGVVFGRQLESLVGRYVEQGEILMHFANPVEMEILVSIDQEQIKSVRANKKMDLRVSFTGNAVFRTQIGTIEPRASDIPPHPTLTAAAGGPLPVRMTDNAESNNSNDDGYRLITPRFTGKCDLPDKMSDELISGQRGTAFVRGREISLGGYCWLRCRHWVRSKLEMAAGL